MIIRLNESQKLRIKFFKESVDVDYADLDVKIKQRTTQIVLDVKVRTRQVWYTKCIIEQLCTDETEQWSNIGQGLAKQSPRDVYSKRTGKKVALKRAMEMAQINDKTERTAIWDLFAQTLGGYR